MIEHLIKKLTAFGLSDKEAKIYLALLELGTAKVSEVAKYSKINRATTYVVLENLKKRGLVGVSYDKKIRCYVASSSEILLHAARAEANRQIEIKENIESAIPELKALHKNTKHVPIVRVFEGKSGLINAFEDTLKCKEKLIRVISAVENIAGFLPDYFPNYIKQRMKNGIKMHGIHPVETMAKKLIKLDEIKFDTPIIIPKDKYKSPADMAIYDDMINLMSSKDGGFAVLIQNKEMTEVMKSIFDLAWEEAKRLNSEVNKKYKIKNR